MVTFAGLEGTRGPEVSSREALPNRSLVSSIQKSWGNARGGMLLEEAEIYNVK